MRAFTCKKAILDHGTCGKFQVTLITRSLWGGPNKPFHCTLGLYMLCIWKRDHCHIDVEMVNIHIGSLSIWQIWTSISTLQSMNPYSPWLLWNKIATCYYCWINAERKIIWKNRVNKKSIAMAFGSAYICLDAYLCQSPYLDTVFENNLQICTT